MALGGAAAALAGCTRLGALNGVNAMTPGDGGTNKIASDIGFGSDPREALDVYAPEKASNLPVIIFFYGGSWSSGARGDYDFAARALAGPPYPKLVVRETNSHRARGDIGRIRQKLAGFAYPKASAVVATVPRAPIAARPQNVRTAARRSTSRTRSIGSMRSL
jgi:hypothetical protein